MEIVELAPGDERLKEVFPVMHELRSHVSFEGFEQIYAEGHGAGYRVAALFDAGECRACAGYRVMTNLVSGRLLYVDDLVTSESARSRGYGRELNEYLAGRAREQGCSTVQLDSATHRRDAHRFYFREGYTIYSFHFVRRLERDG